MNDIEEFIVLEKEITSTEDTIVDSQRESIRKRWEFGKALLARRVGKQLPNGLLDTLVAEIGCSRSELQYRMQAAEQYPTEDEVSTALDTRPSWTQFKKHLAKPKPEPAQRKGKPIPASPISRDPNHEEIVSRSKSGESRASIAKDLGVTDRTVRRELEVEATIEAAAPVDWDSVPGNQREKLDRAKQSIRKELEREFQNRLQAEIDQHKAKLEADLSKYKAEYDERNARINDMRDQERKRYQAGIEAQRAKGLVPVADYRLLLRCFHSDSHGDNCLLPKGDLNAGFNIITDTKFKALLVKEA